MRLVLVGDDLDDLLRQDAAHDGGHGTQLGEQHRRKVLGHLALGKPELNEERAQISLNTIKLLFKHREKMERKVALWATTIL